MPAPRNSAPRPERPLPPRHRDLAERLGAWFDVERRDLPWRRTRDAYAIWLSEVMLQQTRVKTVVEYYPRFLKRYPSVAALAGAKVDDVLAAWSGLGYYRRARALHEGAREVVARYGGTLPSTVDGLRQIPGIGPYTAGAIASIAFGVRAPLVDGNVARVLARIFGVEADVRSPLGVREVWQVAADLVPEERPGRHNEALMELGATVCLPRDPRCEVCPVAGGCVAKEAGRQAFLPLVRKKQPPRHMELAALVAFRGGRLLLAKRQKEGLFGGMWEPPMVELSGNASAEQALSELLGAKNLDLTLVGHELRVLSHRKFRIAVVKGELGKGAPRAPSPGGSYERFAWLRPSELERRGVSTLAQRVLARGTRASSEDA